MVAKGTIASISSPFGLGFSLTHDGVADFGTNKWKISVAPASVSISFDTNAGELVRADHFVSLRAPAGEAGLSYDEEGINHFFTFAHSLGISKLSLKFKVFIYISTWCL